MRARAVWAASFFVIILWPVTWPVQAGQLSGPLVFAPRCHGFLAFNTFEHAGKISFSDVSLVENIFEFKLNAESNQNQSVFGAALPQKIAQFHFWDHRCFRMALIHGDSDAKNVPPIRAKFAGQGARGNANASAEILKCGVPDEISSRGLSRVRGDHPDHWMGLYAQHPKTDKENLRTADIDISSDLGFSYAPSLIDRCFHIAGLDYGRSARMAELFLAGYPEHESGNAETDGRNNEPKREESYRIGRRPLPNGFAFFSIVAGLFGGIVTFLLLSIGRSISRLPSEYSGPKHCGDKETKNDFSSQPSPRPEQKSPHK
jgi:hypothetical protein